MAVRMWWTGVLRWGVGAVCFANALGVGEGIAPFRSYGFAVCFANAFGLLRCLLRKCAWGIVIFPVVKFVIICFLFFF